MPDPKKPTEPEPKPAENRTEPAPEPAPQPAPPPPAPPIPAPKPKPAANPDDGPVTLGQFKSLQKGIETLAAAVKENRELKAKLAELERAREEEPAPAPPEGDQDVFGNPVAVERIADAVEKRLTAREEKARQEALAREWAEIQGDEFFKENRHRVMGYAMETGTGWKASLEAVRGEIEAAGSPGGLPYRSNPEPAPTGGKPGKLTAREAAKVENLIQHFGFPRDKATQAVLEERGSPA